MTVLPVAIISNSLAKPSHKCDMCDVTVPLTPSPYITHRDNNVNPLPPCSVTSFMDDPFLMIAVLSSLIPIQY